jgi:hypothetical protein
MSSQPWYSEAELTALNGTDPEMPRLVSVDEEYNDLDSDDESFLPRELFIEVGAHSTDNNKNRARSYREQVLEEHDTIQATRYRGP